MQTPIVELEHLHHQYGQRVALDDLSLSINGGEIFGFLGPNGSGKTTLFRILSTLIPPTAGRVRMMGMDLDSSRNEIRKHIGVVFQSPSLDKQLTAEENLRHHGHLYGIRGRDLEQRIDEMLAKVGLSDRPRERVGQFSGGMRRRVEVAKGLLNRPRILLLDEPSTGIDPGAKIDLWRHLRDIRQRDKVTILLTTHLMDEADLCDRLAIMDHGRLVANDTPAAMKQRIGGDIITLVSGNPAALRSAIQDRFHVDAEEVNHALRLERRQGHAFIPQLIEAFPGMIESVSLGKPTLEDVFIDVTGHGFKDEPIEMQT